MGRQCKMYIVAIMIELKSTFSCLLGYLLFNYLSLCPQLSCMHCNINPTLLIQGMANDDANVTCSSLTEVGATNSEILASCSTLHHAVEVAHHYTILRYSVRICSALFCIILHYTFCWLSSSKIEMQSRWGSSGPVTTILLSRGCPHPYLLITLNFS